MTVVIRFVFLGKTTLLVMAYQMVEKLEKKLFKEPEESQEYSKIINHYLEKGYVSKVSTDEDCDSIK